MTGQGAGRLTHRPVPGNDDVATPPDRPSRSALAASAAPAALSAPSVPSLPAVTEIQAVVALVVFWVCVDLGPAEVAGPGPLMLLGLLAGSGLTLARCRRRLEPLLVVVAVAGLVAGGLAQRGYREPPPGTFTELVASLATDPEPVGAGWRAIVVVEAGTTGPDPSAVAPDGARLQATAYGRAGHELRSATVGERLVVSGSTRSVGDRPWLRARHVVALASLDEAEVIEPAGPLYRLAETVRSLVEAGASGFEPHHRALYTGLVIGDDRFQPLSQQARFRVAGLSHLLAVSGQNVAFVLLVTWPVVRLVPHRWRFVTVALVLALFVAVTRAEPSVLRATACAGLATWAHLTGRDRSGIRVLTGGVAALVAVDPFLVDVVGFQLSVAASAGILALAPVLVERSALGAGVLRRLLAEPLAVTVAAQLGVAPLLLHHFGPMSVAAVPANLLAGWAAGAVMTLGLTAGLLAGLMNRSGPSAMTAVADVVQAPTEALLWWIDSVAATVVGVPLPQLDGRGLGLVGALAAMLALRPRRSVGPLPGPVPVGQRMLVVITAATLGSVLVQAVPGATEVPVRLAPDCLWIPRAAFEPGEPAAARSGAGSRVPNGGSTRQPPSASIEPASIGLASIEPVSVLIVGPSCSPEVVDIVVRRRIRTIDVVVAGRGTVRARPIIAALVDVAGVGTVLAPPLHGIKGARRMTGAAVIRAPDGPHLVVRPAPSRTSLLIEPVPASNQVAVPGGR